MRNRNTTDLDDYHDQVAAPSFSKGVARIAPSSMYARPKPRIIFTSATKLVDTTALLTVVSFNTKRVFLSVTNNTAAAVFLSFGVITDTNGINAIKLAGNTFISFDSGIVPHNEVYAISTGGQCNITVLEAFEQH